MNTPLIQSEYSNSRIYCSWINLAKDVVHKFSPQNIKENILYESNYCTIAVLKTFIYKASQPILICKKIPTLLIILLIG